MKSWTEKCKRGETMAYKELIKNFNRIRSYMREFYVYGFKNEKNTQEKAQDLMIMNAAA